MQGMDVTASLPRMMDASGSYTDTAEASRAPETVAPDPGARQVAAMTLQFGSSPVEVSSSGSSENWAARTNCYGTPEPVSLLLMAGGLLGLSAMRRRLA